MAILSFVIVLATLGCAVQVMRARRLLNSALWLAATSALVSLLLYLVGAPEVAVIELSVGAGLVTVLFVFAFSIVGEQTQDERSLMPRPLALGLVLASVGMLGLFTLPVPAGEPGQPQFSFAYMLWQTRGLDVLGQIVFIFSGVMGLLGLLADRRVRTAEGAAVATVRRTSGMTAAVDADVLHGDVAPALPHSVEQDKEPQAELAATTQ
jgi:uncharacterized MnhB-related membrane protein